MSIRMHSKCSVCLSGVDSYYLVTMPHRIGGKPDDGRRICRACFASAGADEDCYVTYVDASDWSMAAMQRLAVAVIEQTVTDACSRSATKESMEERISAREWLFDDRFREDRHVLFTAAGMKDPSSTEIVRLLSAWGKAVA